ncbi:MAG: alpha-N-arabinofuranosidase [Clostridia bacterium]|nr:alpha-N-arabinofuranosidase [Clostridia bacterium]
MAKITLHPGRCKGTINKNLFGHFSEHLGRCIYQGIFVGKDSPIPNVNGMRKDVVDALRNIKAPVLRWPGGCFADEYHWEDGIGPQEARKRMVNTHWGGVVEDNSFGTHEFLELCSQIGCEPYINANVGSGTIREMSEWVEYINSDGDSTVVKRRWENGRKDAWNVKFWGVGNENWGCGGNMRPEYYADEYRRYQTYCRNYGNNKLYRIACGPNVDDYRWTEVLMRNAGHYMDALTLHYYTVTEEWADKGSATEFTKEQYYKTLYKSAYMDELITKHLQIMDRYDPNHRVGLIVDEWGTWHNVEPGTNPGFLYQQNTMRDALVAAITFNIFAGHCDRVVMANIAQTVNVLQSVILTEGDQMVLTPTYHVFDLYKAHQNAKAVDCHVEAENVGVDKWQLPQITAAASENDGVITLTCANISECVHAHISVSTIGCAPGAVVGRILAGKPHDFNDFGDTKLQLLPFSDFKIENDQLKINLPPCCVAELTISKE